MAHRALRLACVCLLLVTSTTLAGCVGDVGTDAAAPDANTAATDARTQTQSATPTGTPNSSAGPDGEAVVATFRERMSSLDSYVATQRTNVTVDGNTTVSEVRLWVDRETNELRREVVAPESRAGTVMLRNESTLAIYDPDAGQVTTYPQSSDSVAIAGLPIQTLLESTSIEYVGTEERDGERYYRVRFHRTDSTGGNATLVAWLDTETYFPERVTTTAPEGDGEFTSTTTFTDVELDVELDDSRFTFDVPEDTEWTEYAPPESRTFETLQQLRTNTSLTVPSPSLPASFVLGDAQLTAGTVESATLQYTNGSASLFVVVRNATHGDPPADAEAVDLDGRTVHYVGTGTGGYVYWECGGQTYVVSGTLARGTLLSVAGSLSCS